MSCLKRRPHGHAPRLRYQRHTKPKPVARRHRHCPEDRKDGRTPVGTSFSMIRPMRVAIGHPGQQLWELTGAGAERDKPFCHFDQRVPQNLNRHGGEERSLSLS